MTAGLFHVPKHPNNPSTESDVVTNTYTDSAPPSCQLLLRLSRWHTLRRLKIRQSPPVPRSRIACTSLACFKPTNSTSRYRRRAERGAQRWSAARFPRSDAKGEANCEAQSARFVTGGGGFRYENAVAARFLLDLLAGTNSLGADFGRIGRIDWQARDAGWLLDDLAVSCTHSGADRSTGISIKSDQQVTRGGFPTAFVDIAWAQWLGVGTQRRIREGRDAVVLVTGSLAREVGETWSRTLSEVLETTPERMAARLTAPEGDEGSQSSHLQRALVESFRCPELYETTEIATT